MERLLTPPDPTLSSQGFRLRPFTIEDAEAVKAAGEDPDIVSYTFTPAAPTDETPVRWLTRAIAGWHHGMARFAIVPADSRDDRCAGQIGLFLADHPAGNAESDVARLWDRRESWPPNRPQARVSASSNDAQFEPSHFMEAPKTPTRAPFHQMLRIPSSPWVEPTATRPAVTAWT